MLSRSDNAMFLVIAAFVPFSYLSLADFRVMALLPFVFFGYVITRSIASRRSVILSKPDSSFYLFFVMVLYGLVAAMISESVDSLVAIVFFFIFAYWPFFFSREHLGSSTFLRLVRAYALFATFVAAGLIVQLVAWFAFGIELGRIVFFPGRVAFSFIWMDFSFVSLYLASAIPLSFFSFRASVALALSAVLLAGSVATSARTGIVSLVFVVTVFYVGRSLASMFRGRIRKMHVRILFLFVPLMVVSAAFVLNMISVRSFSVSDSGRLAGYFNAYEFWLKNPVSGAWLDADMYRVQVDLIPHNMLIYVVAMGGLIFFSFFILWLALLLRPIFLAPDSVKLSVLVCLFGFTFLPSVFSAYFFAFLLSLVFLSQRVTSERNTAVTLSVAA